MRLLVTVLLLLPTALAAAQDTPGRPDSAVVRDTQPATSQRPGRRQPVTPELESSAFADARARTLLERARAARMTQDSTLQAYDALSVQRFTVGLGIRRVSRLIFRGESAARVAWSRGSGAWIEPTGSRAAAPIFGRAEARMDLNSATSIPYFPGRESLWIPSSTMGLAQREVDEEQMLHPLAIGAEAYYRYAVGDSMSFRLPDGRVTSLRELRITARRPEWRAFVGSFWFDAEGGSLVRAAYRMSAEMDIWEVAGEDARREAEAGIKSAGDDAPPLLARLVLTPMKANLSAVTVEYGLYEGRFWLPKLQVAEGEVQVGFARLPMKFEESFRYHSVNSPINVPPIPSLAEVGLAAADTGAFGYLLIGDGRRSGTDREIREDSLLRRHQNAADSLRRAAGVAAASGDTAAAARLERRADRNEVLARRIVQRRESCARDSTYVAAVISRFDGAVRTATRLPCDPEKLASSPDLPHALFDSAEELYPTIDREELLKSLGMSLQPGWDPRPPQLHFGIDLLRYNRIEGFSVGAAATSVLGKGYSARAEARIGTGDWIPNAELELSRSNGRTTLGVAAFHRLGVANDDWGTPLALGASAANLLYARDEGFYYRTWGAELRGERDAPGLFGALVQWRLFAERHRTAGETPNTQFSVARAFGQTRFERNIDATELTALGAGGEVSRTFGADPRGTRLYTHARGEVAYTDRSDTIGSTGYGRVLLDATLSRDFGRVAASLTGAAGTSTGDLPLQRAFYLGGLQTVRGQFARPDTMTGHVGEAFWLARTELGLGLSVVRPVLFYDVGWAGPRSGFGAGSRPMSGAGAGVSLLDGLLRFDLSRGIWPEQRWRADLQVGARF
jgi:hypothetical protein